MEDDFVRNPSPDSGEDRAKKALLERPSFSIRSRLLLGFLLFLVLYSAAEITALITLSRLDTKTRFLVIADRYTNEIQQARRYEKNYLLYHSDLRSVLDHVNAAESLMVESAPELNSVLGKENVATLDQHLARYKALIQELPAATSGDSLAATPSALENELRAHGSQMISFALELSERERRLVRTMFRWARLFPILFLALLLGIAIYMANLLFRQINRPLSRLMEITRNIGEGNLTPVLPARKYRDEFTNVVLALNHMMYELRHRQEQMIESHKLRAIGTLTAGVAHELNNPLNNIMLTAAMLEEDYDTLSHDEKLDMVRDLMGEAERSERIVKSLLDFARESEIQTELLQIGPLVDETMKLAQNQIRIKGTEVEVSIPDNLPPIHGDRQQLRQVFLNLILNSLDAMPQGGRLRITAHRPADHGFVTVTFTDNGCGIPAHILPSIFDPFFTTKATSRGTGLGLSVSKGILEEHGGYITVESLVNRGTSFSAHLPVALIPA